MKSTLRNLRREWEVADLMLRRMLERILAMLKLVVATEAQRSLSPLQSEMHLSRLQLGQMLLHLQSQAEAKSSLKDYGFSVWSQTDEDGILGFLVSRLHLSKPKCLEIGAGNFLESNFRFLAEVMNASVFAVDAREDLAREVRKLNVSWLAPVVPHQTWVTPRNINEIIDQAVADIGEIDILSVDLDGNDYWVLEAANLENIKLVMVENNPLFSGSLPVSVPQNDSFYRFDAHHSGLYWGASISAFVHLLESRGFRLVGRNSKGFNAFFLKADIVANDPLLSQFAVDVDLSPKNWGIREGRDPDGNLTFENPARLLENSADLPLVNVATGEHMTLANLAR